MHSLEEMQKQQVGLRLPKYLIDDLDSFTKEYSLNRSEIITEAIKAFIDEQKAKEFYRSFEISSRELKESIAGKKESKSLGALIDELEDNRS
ncbi:MAG: hypothetical protein JXQ68_07200 [Campylobacterales bacterium]|nr:hypothetical protein [Campylobacterales bacterium]